MIKLKKIVIEIKNEPNYEKLVKNHPKYDKYFWDIRTDTPQGFPDSTPEEAGLDFFFNPNDGDFYTPEQAYKFLKNLDSPSH